MRSFKPNRVGLAARFRSLRSSDDVVSLIKSAWVQIFAIGVNAGQSILLPLMVGPNIFGIFAGLYTNMTVAIGVGRGPIELLVQRGNDPASPGQNMIYRRRGLFWVNLAALLVAASLFLGLSTIQRWPVSIGLYVFLSAAVFVGAASGLRRGVLVSRNRTYELELLDLVVRPALFLLAIGACWWIGIAESAVLWLLGLSFFVVLALPNLKTMFSAAAMVGGKDSPLQPWSHLLASNGLSLLVKNADVILLGMYLDATTVGRYFIVARIADLAAFGYNFTSARFVHRFARAIRAGEWSDSLSLCTRANKFGLSIAGFTAIVILAAAPPLLPIIDVGLSEYIAPLAILLLAQVINATLGVQGAFLTAIDPRYTLGIKLLLNPLALLAMILSVPIFGPIGASIVSATFILAMQLTNTILLRRVIRSKEEEEIHRVRVCL